MAMASAILPSLAPPLGAGNISITTGPPLHDHSNYSLSLSHSHSHSQPQPQSQPQPHQSQPSEPLPQLPSQPLPQPVPQLPSQPQSQSLSQPLPSPAGSIKMPTSRPPPLPLDQMRAYRACLNCRNRKSKCDLDLHQGRPPCRRCQRENKECVLGESHRGGRRVRKKPKLEEPPNENLNPPSPHGAASVYSNSPNHSPNFSPSATGNLRRSDSFHNQYDSRGESGFWQNTTSVGSDSSRHTAQTNLTVPDNPFRSRCESTVSIAGENNKGIASADLQNPSDALELLAQVADGAEDEVSNSGDLTPCRLLKARQRGETHARTDFFYYKPIQDGLISLDTVYTLFQTYEEQFHPFFPIIPAESFDTNRLPWISKNEPHLFSAILTVASRDNEPIHQICYDHMQQLISMIIAGADANVEAVEALLLLSQWVSNRPQAASAIGRGEEDRVAWMYIGTALRLAYYIGLDNTSFKSDTNEDAATFNRKRLVWLACYYCDRQVSVRVGKGFWARGPGPLSGLKSGDFPTLQRTQSQEDDRASIFQANLELTQIFSNVHDILYSSKGRGWKEMLEGRYAKYLDDFCSSVRGWSQNWRSLNCSSKIKAPLLLTYDYLRLYVNAFAYQATISRALEAQKENPEASARSHAIPLIDASTSDARFIYEALNAAKSVLTTYNNFVDPTTLRYMPTCYYLFIIYSAVFLYKARSTTTMTDKERNDVRTMIQLTIERLLQAGAGGGDHMGTRYARLLQMLWRRSPKSSKQNEDGQGQKSSNPNANQDPAQNHNRDSNNNNYDPSIDPALASQHAHSSNNSHHAYNFDPNAFNYARGNTTDGMPHVMSTGFSWLDLGATCKFATQNAGPGYGSGSVGSSGDIGEEIAVGAEMSPFNMGFVGDWVNVEGDGGFIF